MDPVSEPLPEPLPDASPSPTRTLAEQMMTYAGRVRKGHVIDAVNGDFRLFRLNEPGSTRTRLKMERIRRRDSAYHQRLNLFASPGDTLIVSKGSGANRKEVELTVSNFDYYTSNTSRVVDRAIIECDIDPAFEIPFA